MKKLQTIQEVEPLLNRFMDGTSTLEEEAQLADFFRTHEVVGEWREYKEMFALFDQGQVDHTVEVTAPTQSIEVEGSTQEKKHFSTWKWVSAAAVLALLVGSFLFFHRGDNTPKPPLIAQTDTLPTQRPQTKEHEESQEPKEKEDTTNVSREIERAIYKTPKVYLAKAAPSSSTPTKELTEEEKSDPELLALEADIERIMAEHEARMNAMRTAEDPYEMRNEIRRRGERLTQSIEMAISNDNY